MIVLSILVLNGSVYQFVGRQIVQAGDVYCVEHTQIRCFTAAEGFDPTRPTEEMDDGSAAKLVFSQII